MSDVNKEVVRRSEDAWNEGDIAAAIGCFAPDYVEHNPLPGLPPNREGLRTLLTAFRNAFPDGHVTIDFMLADGDKVVYHSTARGTHRGEFMGIPASGRPVEVQAIHIHRVVDGKIVEHWGQSDSLGLMQQLGVIPQPQR